MKRVAIYCRVSTDDQTVEHQTRALAAIAERRGWQVVATYTDEGISGSKGRDKRPGLDAMLKDATRRKFDMVAAVAIDRLGRSLVDLLTTIETLENAGVDLFVDAQGLDTSTAMGKLIFQVTGAFAEFERSMIRERTKRGLATAKAKGVRLGRPPIPPITVKDVQAMLGTGASLRSTARKHGLGIGTVFRIRDEMAA